jgi:citrate synthase
MRRACQPGDNKYLLQPWRTAIVQADDATIRLRGYDITELMTRATFADTVFLLHRERLPNSHERRLLDAILISVADHGSGAPSCATARLAASGNRESLSAAIAAGILAIGDDHGGAGAACMSMIAEGVALAREKSIPIAEAAGRIVEEARAAKQRLPGMGHRVHSVDPRTAVLFAMAREEGVAGDGVLFMEALDIAVREKIKPLPVNIDGALAAILHDLGFPPEAGKLIFIVGRVAGLTAEVAEEYAREKPMRIRVPVEYDGVPPRSIE